MSDAQILVVEDESIVAKDIQNRLRNMGYEVPATSSTAEDAIEKVQLYGVDLVLMDIMLKGAVDGISAAATIRNKFNIPVIYLTAYSDTNTLERAKISEPFGFLLKPFEERELHSTIEMALYKHKMEKRLKESEQWLSTTLKSIGDGVIATDRNGKVAFMNVVAEKLTGWNRSDALGRELNEIFNIIDEKTRTHVESPVAKILREHVPFQLPYNTNLIAKDGLEVPIDDSASPITNIKGEIIGVVLAFRDITERKMAERVLRQHANYLVKRLKELTCLYDVVNVTERKDISTSDMIACCLRAMPAAWQYPELTAIRIKIGDEVYTSDNFRETTWRQSADIVAGDDTIGIVEVFYLQGKPEKDEGPFLKEERSLINALALEIGHLTHRSRSEKQIYHYQTQLANVVKEMNFAFTLAEIIKDPDASLEEIANRIIEVLPKAMREPSRVKVKIILDDMEFGDMDFGDSTIRYTANIIMCDDVCGVLDVGYAIKGDSGIGFLKEEKTLVDSVARQLGYVLQWRREEARWKETVAELEASVSH